MVIAPATPEAAEFQRLVPSASNVEFHDPKASGPPDFRVVKRSELYESPTNPRTHFSESGMTDITASVGRRGIDVPLLVREKHHKGKKFEIIAGARRYRAATAAKLELIPVIVRVMADAEVIELQLVENLQREDVHFINEAESFEALMRQHNYSAELLAEKIGKEISYVHRRIRLVTLAPDIKKACVDETLSIGHALLLCRLDPRQQVLAFNAIREVKDGEHIPGQGWVRHERVVTFRSVRILDHWIKLNIFLNLSAAPWSKTDADLVPKAGPCSTCVKRTGANPILFDDVGPKTDNCTDPSCWAQKQEARLVKIEAAAKAAGSPIVRVAVDYVDERELKKTGALYYHSFHAIDTGKNRNKDRCEHVERAIVVVGPRTGSEIDICRSPKCEMHATGVRAIGGSSKRVLTSKEKLEAIGKRAELATRRELLNRIMRLSPAWSIPAKELRILAIGALPDRLACAHICKAFEITVRAFSSHGYTSPDAKRTLAEHAEKLNGVELVRLVLFAILWPSQKEWAGSDEIQLLKTAGAVYGVAYDQVLAEVKQPLVDRFNAIEAKKKKSAASKPKAKSAKRSAQPGTCRVCGCTDDDCSQCVAKTGSPCSWVSGSNQTLCSACKGSEKKTAAKASKSKGRK